MSAAIVELKACGTCNTVHSGATCPKCVRPLRPEDVTGLPPDWKPSEGNPDHVDPPDDLGHRWASGKCLNQGCTMTVGSAHGVCPGKRQEVEPSYGSFRVACGRVLKQDQLEEIHRVAVRVEREHRLLMRDRFSPRNVTWCPTCLGPFDGVKCAECHG